MPQPTVHIYTVIDTSDGCRIFFKRWPLCRGLTVFVAYIHPFIQLFIHSTINSYLSRHMIFPLKYILRAVLGILLFDFFIITTYLYILIHLFIHFYNSFIQFFKELVCTKKNFKSTMHQFFKQKQSII